MGNNSSDFKPRREQPNGRGLSLLYNTEHHNPKPIKPFTQRMESKLLMWLITIVPTYIYGLVILLNIDNVKGVILFAIAVLYGLARLFFYVIKQNQERRMRELDIREKKRSLNIID
jgi:uncharacterized membrane protein